jgi:hypothetical protein
MLPSIDVEHLQARGVAFNVTSEGGMMCIVFPAFALPTGYDQPNSDLLVRLSPGYPDVPPDMWWFDPPARRADGQEIPATQVVEPHLGRNWQRWSRHFNPGQWRAGVDTLESFLALIRKELAHGVASAAA